MMADIPPGSHSMCFSSLNISSLSFFLYYIYYLLVTPGGDLNASLGSLAEVATIPHTEPKTPTSPVLGAYSLIVSLFYALVFVWSSPFLNKGLLTLF